MLEKAEGYSPESFQGRLVYMLTSALPPWTSRLLFQLQLKAGRLSPRVPLSLVTALLARPRRRDPGLFIPLTP